MSSDEGAATTGQRVGVVGAVVCFSLSLSISSVAVPVLMVRAGHGTATVGFVIALSAVTQIAVRFGVGQLLRRLADKQVVGLAALLMALGSGALVGPTTIGMIVLSQLLQGAARGLFWTGIQTHAVRAGSTAARGLASVNLASGVGLIVGPGAAGLLLEWSTALTMGVATVAAASAVLPVLLMARRPVFGAAEKRRGERPVSRRAQVRLGSWAAASAGAWRGLMGAYVPVALSHAAHSSTAIGLVVAAANAATILAGWLSGRLRREQAARGLPVAIAVTGLGLAGFGAGAEVLVLAAAALVASGLAMGMLQTIGPAVAAEAVGAQEQGDAMAVVGLYRAGATFAAPFGVAALALAMPLGWALVIAGAALALPAGYRGRGARP